MSASALLPGNGGPPEEGSLVGLPPPLPAPPRRRASLDAEKEQLDALVGLFGAPFARTARFWADLAWSLVLAAVLGAVALAFFNCFEFFATVFWNDDAYAALIKQAALANTTNTWGAAAPDYFFVGLGAAAGLAVGCVKVAWSSVRTTPFPTNPPSLVTEVKDLRCHDPATCAPLMLCSAIGLACGTSVGPEAALGAVGASLGSFLGEHTSTGRQRPGLYATLGMAAAFGPLLPSPMLAVLMLHELGFAAFSRSSKTTMGAPFMEFVILAGVASSGSYALFVSVEDLTFLNTTVVPPVSLAVRGSWSQYMAAALALGVLCGIVGLVGLLCLGIGKKLGGAFHALFQRRCGRRVAVCLTPVVGGALFGFLAVAFPMTLGDGNAQLSVIIENAIMAQLRNANGLGPGPLYSAGFLAALAFAKCIALGICLGFGFIGGQIFPLVFAGACVGSLVTQITGLHVLVALPCCIVAVPCAFTPIVFSLVGMTGVLLGLGGDALAPVFVACITSFATVNGLGVVHKALARQLAALKVAASNAEVDAVETARATWEGTSVAFDGGETKY